MRHNLLILASLVLLGVLLHRSVRASSGGIPEHPEEAHKYADAVLAPRFLAAVSDWLYRHPQDTPERAWEHVRKIDVADRERWRRAREAFRDLDNAMRRAGY